MLSAVRSESYDRRSLIFGLVTVVCATVTGWAIVDGQDRLTVLLLGAVTVYALGNTLPAVRRRVPRFDRLAAVPLGVVGAIAYAMEAPTDLPIFFMLLGGGSLVDLLWDPTGIYEDDAG